VAEILTLEEKADDSFYGGNKEEGVETAGKKLCEGENRPPKIGGTTKRRENKGEM